MHERVRSYKQDLVSSSSLNSSRIARLAFHCQIPDIWPLFKSGLVWENAVWHVRHSLACFCPFYWCLL